MRIKRYFDALSYYGFFVKPRPLLLAKKGINLLKYSLLPKGNVCHNLPLSAQIEPTLRCNLRCTMCVREHFKQGDMSFDSFREIINQLDSLIKIHLQGLGEPFLNPEIFKMIDYASSRNIMVSIISNGTLFNENIIEKISMSKLFEIGVSVDEVEKSAYESIRVGANFDRVKENISKLSASLIRNRSRAKLFLAVTVMRSNLNRIPDFIRFANQVGVKRVVFQRVQTKDDFVRYYKSDFRKSEEFVSHSEVMEIFRRSKPFADKIGVKILFEESKVKCLWPWRGIYVTWAGDVTPCCMIVDPKSVALGNLLDVSIRRIWNSRRYKAIRRSVLEKKPYPFCAGCRAM